MNESVFFSQPSLIWVVSELSEELKDVVVGDSTAPVDGERLYQLTLDCWMSLESV